MYMIPYGHIIHIIFQDEAVRTALIFISRLYSIFYFILSFIKSLLPIVQLVSFYVFLYDGLKCYYSFCLLRFIGELVQE